MLVFIIVTIMIIINMLMPVQHIVLHIYISYWYSLTTAFWPNLTGGKRDWFVGLQDWIVGLVNLIDENGAPAPMWRSTSRSELNSGAGAPFAKWYSRTAT
jgi:hypothetical protein